jgi:hypothetical protein
MNYQWHSMDTPPYRQKVCTPFFILYIAKPHRRNDSEALENHFAKVIKVYWDQMQIILFRHGFQQLPDFIYGKSGGSGDRFRLHDHQKKFF